MWGWTKALLLAALAIAIGVCCTAQCAAPQARDGCSSESRTASKREGYSSLRERDQSLRKAVALHKQGSFQAAESLLRQVLRDRPADSAALSLLGVVLDAQRKHEEAEHSYLQALASAPRSAGAWNNLGNHYLALEQAEKAESAFLKLLEINPRHANANVQLARIAVLRKRGAEALRYLGNLGLSDQKEPAIGLLRAEALHLVGRRQKATTTVDRLLQEFGRDPKVAFTLGVTLASWKEYGRAEAAFSRALEYDPSNPEVLYNLGVVALRSDRLERAQGVFESLLKRRPGDAGAHFHLAQVLVRRGETERALLSLLEARKLAPDRTDILLMLAQTSAEAGFSTDAAIAYEEYLRRNPSDALARRERGYAYARAGMVPEALADLTWYVAKFPQDPAGHLELAMTYTLVDRAKAFYHIEEALWLRQEFVPARQLRGALQYLEGRASEALPDLEFVADRNPKNVRVLEQLGQAYLALNRPAEAEKLLRRAVELAPENRRALMHLGRALSDLGRSEEAATYLDRLERIGPDRGSVKSGGGLFDFLALSPTEQRERYERNLMAAMRTRPSDPELKVRWASLLMADGKTEASLAGFREVLELSPNAAVLAAGSRSLIDGGHYELARIYLERLVRMDPRPEHVLDLAIAVSQTTGAAAGLRELDGIAEGSRTGDYWLLRAQLLEQQERTAEAVESVRHGVRAAATRPELYIQASLFLLKHGRDGEALAVMEEAANTLPEQRDILLTKVMLLEVLGKNVEAQNLLRRIQLQWPEWSHVHLVRSVLLELESKADEAALALRAAAALGEEKPEALAVRVRTSRKREPPAKEDRAAVVRSLLLALYPPGHWR